MVVLGSNSLSMSSIGSHSSIHTIVSSCGGSRSSKQGAAVAGPEQSKQESRRCLLAATWKTA